MKVSKSLLLQFALASIFFSGHAQTSGLPILPGKGIAEHDFLCSGEADDRHPFYSIYLVHNGRVAWRYDVPAKNAAGVSNELGDATMRSNGNVVFCRKTGAGEVTPEKKVVWDYEAPKGTEIHSVEPVGKRHVLMVINGAPARVLLINVKTAKTENEFIIPTGKPSPHLQFRRVRTTPTGTIIAAHLDSNLVAEYNMHGKQVWSVKAMPPYSVQRLKNGNTLMTTNRISYISEVNPQGEIVWDLKQEDVPDIKLYQLQVALRLDNGNTVFSNWCHNAIKNRADWPSAVQLIEVSADKKVVWALRQWENPDLGLITSVQILDRMKLNKIAAFNTKGLEK